MFWTVVLYILIVFFGLMLAAGIAAVIIKPSSVYAGQPDQNNPLEGRRVIFISDESYKENADGVRGYLKNAGESGKYGNFYSNVVKRVLDIVISFAGLVILSPVFLVLIIAIAADDPGPVFFTQKRVGRNKQFFKLHKFRSMKMATPRDVPTHMLENPEQYITKTGRFLRIHSLDELPQIWDIFMGNMSIIGPRPALWNQDLLIAERDRYRANDVRPGLTGWAQINGRDKLEIHDKAALDGEYVARLGFSMDCRCFFRSLHILKKDDSLVEGTGDNKKDEEGAALHGRKNR